MIGEAANSANVNMSNVETRALENWLLRKGVKTPRSPRKTSPQMILCAERADTASTIAPTETTTSTAIR